MAVIISEVRDPEKARRGEIEHESILRVIQGLRLAGFPDGKISELISKQFHLILPYAKNYVGEYDQELALHILPWESN